MSNSQQSQEDLQKHLEEQVHFLRASADAYDAGYEAEAKRMALTMRILLHDSNQSTSLLTQLGLKDGLNLYDSGLPARPGMLNMGASLVVIPGGGGNAIPFFDDSPPGTSGYVKFDEYWNKPVLYADNRHFTRAELIRNIANKDGGAHVDPKLNEEYSNLSRNNSFGWRAGTSDADMAPVGIVELATIRQIAHELLRSLVPDYPRKMLARGNRGLMFPRVFFERIDPDNQGTSSKEQ